jgi:hypothetical protein
MSIKIELRIKLKDESELILSEEEAKELYEELTKIFAKEKEYIPYPSTWPLLYEPYKWWEWKPSWPITITYTNGTSSYEKNEFNNCTNSIESISCYLLNS